MEIKICLSFFENIDDLARKAFEEVVPKHAPDFLRKAAAAEDINPFAFFNYAMFRDYSEFFEEDSHDGQEGIRLRAGKSRKD